MQRKILILEDDRETLELCKEICEQLNFEVATSQTSEHIIDQLHAVKPDILLIDNWLPGPGGIKAIAMLKADQTFANLPIIFFSAVNNFQLVACDSQADCIIQKPFDIADLEEALIRLSPKE